MVAPSEDSDKHYVTGFMRKLPNNDVTWYDLMDKMIGSKKQRFSDVMVPPVGIPQAPRSPEEIRIQRAMDSCMFKSIMSCVIGKCFYHFAKVLTAAGDGLRNLTLKACFGHRRP